MNKGFENFWTESLFVASSTEPGSVSVPTDVSGVEPSSESKNLLLSNLCWRCFLRLCTSCNPEVDRDESRDKLVLLAASDLWNLRLRRWANSACKPEYRGWSFEKMQSSPKTTVMSYTKPSHFREVAQLHFSYEEKVLILTPLIFVRKALKVASWNCVYALAKASPWFHQIMEVYHRICTW